MIHSSPSDKETPSPVSPQNRPALVVCLEEEIFSPVSYLRIVRHLQALTTRYRISILVLPRQLPEALARIPSASLLIMARNRHESSYHAARRAAECGVPILCDIDDYVWEFPDYSKVERHKHIYTDQILSLASCVTTPSEQLGRLIHEKHPGINIHCFPNAGNVCNDGSITFTPCVMANSDFFRIPEMKADFFRALHDAARESGRHLLLYYFSNDPPEHFTDDPCLRVVWMGFRSYSSYKQLLNQLAAEFGFVLLRDEQFSRHKSVVKFAEFGFAGTIGIYSRVEPYAGYISDGVTGFLTDNTYESWKNTVARALCMDDNAKGQMKTRILHIAQQQFDFDTIHADFCALLSAHAKPRPPAQHFPDEIPDLKAFKFREAYAYPAWVMHVERPRLEKELELVRGPLWDRLRRRGAAEWMRWRRWTQTRHKQTQS